MCICRSALSLFNSLRYFHVDTLVTPMVSKKRPQEVARVRPLAAGHPGDAGELGLVLRQTAGAPVMHDQEKVSAVFGSVQMRRVS
jgi:hypothetical protein